MVYVAFDILYDDNQSLINLPLRVRQQRLAAAVKCLPADPSVGVLLGPDGGCIRGRIVTLLPNLPVPLPVEGGCSEGLGATAVGMPAPQFQVRRFCGGSLGECGELECCRGRRRAEFANWGCIATLLPNQLAHPLVSVRGLGAQCVVACMYVGRICPGVRALICLPLSRLFPPPLVHIYRCCHLCPKVWRQQWIVWCGIKQLPCCPCAYLLTAGQHSAGLVRYDGTGQHTRGECFDCLV